jgi:hypothetical protein
MTFISPLRMIFIAGVLVVLGFLLPFLMVLRMIPSTFALNFIAYGASFGGLILGIIGSALWVRSNRPRDEDM